MRPVLLCCLALLAMATESNRYPADAPGVVDVVKAYGADPSGAKDSTAALQRALSESKGRGSRILWLAKGTYAVSAMLTWPGPPGMGPSLQGETRDGTVLRLADKAAGFQDPDAAQGVLRTGWGSADNFCIDIRDLTIDTGSGNPGASGIQYMTNNQGGIRRVTVRSGDGAGVAGLDLGYTDMIGPCYLADIAVEGFDVGIRTTSTVNSNVVERVTLKHQRLAGIRNNGQCMSIRKLTSVQRDGVPGVVNEAGWSFMTLIDSELAGSGEAAVVNRAFLLARNVETKGYVRSLRDDRAGREDHESRIDEYRSHEPLALHESFKRTLGLPIVDTPEQAWGDPATWADVRTHGANGGDEADDTAAFQKAVDSGASTVFIPAGKFRLDGNVVLRGKVTRILGVRGEWGQLAWSTPAGVAGGVFQVGKEAQPLVEFADLCAWDLGGGGRPLIVHDGPGTVVLRSMNTLLKSDAIYQSMPGAGPLHVEDVSCQFPHGNKAGGPNIILGRGQQAWMRQFNPETDGTAKIRNEGADLWLLGLKTERGTTLLEATGGRSEILGGLCYPCWSPEERPMFKLTDAIASITIGEAGFHQRFSVVVEDTRGGETRQLKLGQAPDRCAGSALVLYANRPAVPGSAKAPAAPAAKAASANAVRLSWKAVADAVEYVIERDGVAVGSTAATGFTDSGLADGTTYGYTVSARGRDLTLARSPAVKATTTADTAAPRVQAGRVRLLPARINLAFDEAISPDSLAAATFAASPKLEIRERRLLGDGRSIQLITSDPPPGTAAVQLTIDGLSDRASKPNAMRKVTTKILAAKPPTVQTTLDFAGGTVGIANNGDWKGGILETTQGPSQPGAADAGSQVKVTRFCQALVGKTQINKGRTYSVSLRMRADKPANLTVQFRQWDAPYTTYASATLTPGPEVGTYAAEFTGLAYSNEACIFLVADGDNVFWFQQLQVAWFED